MRLIDADALLEALLKIERLEPIEGFNGWDNQPDAEGSLAWFDSVFHLIYNAPTIAREGWVSVPESANEVMKDNARSFLLGLELGIKDFTIMVEHLRNCNAYIPEWFLKSKGHLNKMAKAHYIYEAMMEAAPTEKE